MPSIVKDAPVLNDTYLLRLNDAFWKLSTTRSVGMSALGPIPWSDMHHFALVHGYDIDQIEYDSFIYLISAMDNAFLDHQRAEAEAESRRKNKPTKAGPRRKKVGR